MKPEDPPTKPVGQPPQSSAPPTRRRFSRVAVDLRAQYSVGERPDWQNCTIVNIGAGGVRLQSLTRLFGGASVSIRFDFDRRPIVVKARIVDSMFDRERGSYFSSAAFMSMPPEQQLEIDERVDELRAAGQT
ncbi:MAG: PilZ domain-containing protein [Candidatus Velthaea sp.]|jgi:c-di-GMP-binding flagellar brake protein YcgR